MNFLQYLKTYCSVLTVSALLCSCSSAVFPEIIEEDETSVSGEESSFIGHKGRKIEMAMPEEGNSLQADNTNAVYDEDKELDEAMNVNITDGEEKISAAETKPVKKEDITKAEPAEVEPKEVKFSEELSEEESIVQPSVLSGENGGPSVSYRIDTFYFANGSSVLDSKYNKQIREIANLAKSKKNAVVNVQGFASSRTRNTDIVSHKLANFKVSAERAQSVANALKRMGLPENQIVTEALSDSAPAYLEVMPEGERLNRRVEVYITY